MSNDESILASTSAADHQVYVYLKPDRFDVLPNMDNSAQQWIHWRLIFNNFLSTFKNNITEDLKLQLLINYITADIFQYIIQCHDYKTALKMLDNIYKKPTNEIFARHVLLSRKQKPGENIENYLQELKILANKCNFREVNAEQNREDYLRDAFVAGLSSDLIREKLLENVSLTLEVAYVQSTSLEINYRSSNNPEGQEQKKALRRSTRSRRIPAYLQEYELG